MAEKKCFLCHDATDKVIITEDPGLYNVTCHECNIDYTVPREHADTIKAAKDTDRKILIKLIQNETPPDDGCLIMIKKYGDSFNAYVVKDHGTQPQES